MIPNDLLALLPADLAAILAAIDVERTKLNPNLLNITPEEKKNFQNLGYSSSEFGEIIMNMATQHSMTIPGDITFAKVQKIHDLRRDLLTIKADKVDVDELIDDLIAVAGIILMPLYNRIYANASEIAAKGDYPFNEMVKEAAKRYEKGPRSSGTEFKIPGGSEAKISKVIPGSLFINNGTTIVRFTFSSELSGVARKTETLTVNPGDSVPVPAGWTTIVVYNVSAENEGSFIVKVRK